MNPVVEGHGYSDKALASLVSRLWRNERTPLLNGVHCLEYDKFAITLEPKGYARPSLDNRKTFAHRASLSIAIGRPLADDEVAMHRCDNPLCCEPKHLKLGTILENNEDRKTKGRTRTGKRTLISKECVGQIKLAMLTNPGITTAELKRRFPGISENVFYCIRVNRRHQDVVVTAHPRKATDAVSASPSMSPH